MALRACVRACVRLPAPPRPSCTRARTPPVYCPALQAAMMRYMNDTEVMSKLGRKFQEALKDPELQVGWGGVGWGGGRAGGLRAVGGLAGG